MRVSQVFQWRIIFAAAVFVIIAFCLTSFIWIQSFNAELSLDAERTDRYYGAELRDASQPSRQFMMFAMKLQKEHNFAPSAAARLFAYTAGIYADVLESTDDSEQAAAATALMLVHLLPEDREEINAFFHERYGSEPVVTGAAQTILTEYTQRADDDNFTLQWSEDMIPAGPRWYVRDGDIDEGAMSGSWKPWLLDPNVEFSVAPPPEPGTLADSLELAKVQYAVAHRTSEMVPVVVFWHGASGFIKGANNDNISPAGVWQNILFTEEGSLDDAAYARAQKLLAQSVADSFIQAWKTKYTYYMQRPSMRIKDLDIVMADPPFPSYVSGHSTISNTAAVVLTALFPDKQEIWMKNAHDARYSRLVAGIHFDIDNEVGENLGARVGEAIVAHIDGVAAPAHREPHAPLSRVVQLFQLASIALADVVHAVSVPEFRLGNWFTRSPMRFTDVTSYAGVTYTQRPDTDVRRCTAKDNPLKGNCILEIMAGGATVGDFDNDGWPDLYVTRLNEDDILFRNQGDGTFADVTEEVGLSGKTERTNGALFVDIDNDGDLDLYVTTIGEKRHFLFINDGAGAFFEEGIERNAAVVNDTIHAGTSIAAGDYDNDGWLDLHINEWRKYSMEPESAPSNAVLLKNRGSAAPGHFVDVTQKAGVSLKHLSERGVFAFSSTFVDMDDDAWPDLVISGDFGTSRLFWNNGDGTFMDSTEDAGVGTDENGMGSAIGDYDGDGALDWFVTSVYSPKPCRRCSYDVSGNRLYRNIGSRQFIDSTDVAGVRDGGWGWGASWLDGDNDGRLDLVMTNGMKTPRQVDATIRDEFATDQIRLWHNGGDGAMTEIALTAGLDDESSGKALVTFDYDRDGDMDLFIVNNSGEPRLYRNDTKNDNDWLRVRVLTELGGRDALGAVVTVKVDANGPGQVRVVGVNGSFLGQSENVLTFGLGSGDEPIAEVRIRWPWLEKEVVLTDVARRSELVVDPDGV